jgi:sterol desaturase/sphingolipid hydroxylase (fatty acid hydroxylase superfamily)
MFYYINELILYHLLFTMGDYSLYFITNKLNDAIFRKTQRTTAFKIPNIIDWSIGNSLSYTFIYLIYTNKIGYLYLNIGEKGEIYTIVSPFIYLFYQDLAFYTIHRLAHTPFLYKKIHYVHHLYRQPSSWVTRISHCIDSNLENIAFTLPALLFPIHIYIWMVCMLFTLIWGNFLHDSTNQISLKFANDNTDHCLHHSYGEKNCNFAYYFNHWDKIFGTYKTIRLNI